MNNSQYSNPGSKKHITRTVFLILVLVLISGIAYGVWKIKPASMTDEQITEPTTPESTIQLEPDITADWKVYINEKYEYEIKYPSSWLFEEYPVINSVGFGNLPPPEGTGEASPTVAVDIFSDSLPETIKRFSDKDHLNLRDIIQDSIIIDNLKATKIEGYIVREGPIKIYDGFKTAGVFFQKGNTIYVISFVEQYKNDLEDYEIFKRMISTFRFVD